MKNILSIALATILSVSLYSQVTESMIAPLPTPPSDTSCTAFYHKKPTVFGVHYTICNNFYVTEYNPLTKTPLYSADVLTADSVAKSTNIKRVNSFHIEHSIPITTASTLKDYTNSGYDRGHIVPCDDMPDSVSQYQSFSLSNMVPQNPNNNRGLWKKLENEARNYTKTEAKVYVISGPIYDNYTTKLHSVIVPTRLFKVIYLPSKNKTLVYVVKNINNSDLNITTIDALQKVVPIKF